ncbi:tRNA pseudouridine(55) synthase TruB [Candidatus Peribacteria bacterium RIFCSPHIGHO2_02_FULL_49_16]|nr:MAG: tRNA pseudouridine(55) synthase TruB [Candidatus Peribacteria bacterium RIFCSPHIGHO2_01_FULL_49_38]OGJ59586.1 MAG: tRNA pseudouridine(55) synthase TruB [Candidatus Peribacteria bacterium RIFCSPHIGHO2_02_FULL_49_16]
MVSAVRKALHERAIGHLGTLDPAACGLLVLAIGKKALKVIELYKELTKEYDAHILLGKISTTYDREGVIEDVMTKPGWQIPTRDQLHATLQERFEGVIEQVPPAYSAVHIGGYRAYEYARMGVLVAPPARKVNITRCSIVAYDYPNLCLSVTCTAGTYIRSLAHDLGKVLRSGGYLSELKRTRVGEWSLMDAKNIENCTWAHVLPLKSVLHSQPSLELTNREAEEIRYGRDITRLISTDTIVWHMGLPLAIVTPNPDGKTAHPRKVL